MKRITSILASTALTAGLGTVALAPEAAAAAQFVANSDNSVRCALYDGETLCVSDRARKSQPQCNPKGELIPAVSIQRKWVGTKCWNQGFERQPSRLQPFQVYNHVNRVVFSSPTGDLYILDMAKPALVRAGGVNAVLFSL